MGSFGWSKIRLAPVLIVLVGLLPSGCSTGADGCGRELSRSEIISIVDRELVARYGSSERPGKTEIEISRSGCDYVYLEKEIPATPGGWFGVTINKDGKVTDFMPGV
jgi:hypothetical protein